MTDENTNPWTAERLLSVGLTLTDPDELIVRCNSCGKMWLPLIQRGGGVNPRWWRCENRCNANKRLRR